MGSFGQGYLKFGICILDSHAICKPEQVESGFDVIIRAFTIASRIDGIKKESCWWMKGSSCRFPSHNIALLASPRLDYRICTLGHANKGDLSPCNVRREMSAVVWCCVRRGMGEGFFGILLIEDR